MDISEVIMTIIAYSGEAKSFSLKAIRFAREKDFEEADKALDMCKEKLEVAHKSSAGLLVHEARNNDLHVSLLMVHALDHFSDAETTLEFAQELVYLYKERQ